MTKALLFAITTLTIMTLSLGACTKKKLEETSEEPVVETATFFPRLKSN